MSPNAFQPAVYPVVDYEPPAFGGPPRLPAITAPARRARRAVPSTARTTADDGAERARLHAATFADAALRRVLEVTDRRRPLIQLRPLMSTALVDSLLPGSSPRGDAGPARLRRVLAQLSRPDATAAEVAASYSRGDRLHAIACRVELQPTATGPRWQVVALHMG